MRHYFAKCKKRKKITKQDFAGCISHIIMFIDCLFQVQIQKREENEKMRTEEKYHQEIVK